MSFDPYLVEISIYGRNTLPYTFVLSGCGKFAGNMPEGAPEINWKTTGKTTAKISVVGTKNQVFFLP